MLKFRPDTHVGLWSVHDPIKHSSTVYKFSQLMSYKYIALCIYTYVGVNFVR